MNYKHIIFVFLVIVIVLSSLTSVSAIFGLFEQNDTSATADEEGDDIDIIIRPGIDEDDSFYFYIGITSSKYDSGEFLDKQMYVNLTDDNGTTTTYNLTIFWNESYSFGYPGVLIDDLPEASRYNVSVYFPGGDGLPPKHYVSWAHTEDSFMDQDNHRNDSVKYDISQSSDDDLEVSDEPIVHRVDTEITGRDVLESPYPGK